MSVRPPRLWLEWLQAARRPGARAGAALLAALLGAGCGRGDPAAALASLRQRDDLSVVLVVVDTLRADRLSAWGYARETSPTLERLARRGIRFEHCLSQSSWTKASMASLWTSTYPATHGVVRAPDAIPEAARLPAEILHDAGFRTVGLHRNTWVDSNFGFAQGFDIYHQPAPLADPPGFERRKPGGAPMAGSDESVTTAAAEFLERQGEGRFLLYLHYMDVHEYAYDGAADRFGDSYADAYDNAILWFDHNLAALVAALEAHGAAHRTLLVVAADHGEELQEHGEIGHARTLHREVVDVPLLIVPPEPFGTGLVVHTPVANVDLWPTLLEWLKLPALEGAQGRSLVPLIEAAARGGAGAPAPEPVTRFAALDVTWSSSRLEPLPHLLVVREPWRLHEWFPPGGPSTGELYDLEHDPGEQHDLARARPEVVGELAALGRAHREAPAPPWGAAAHVEIDRMRLGQLQALGYVVE